MSRHSDAMNHYLLGMERVKNMPQPINQKFDVGARVRIAEKLPNGMQHFQAGKTATVEHTYAHAYGGNDYKHYSLNIDGYGSVAWYMEDQLTLI